MSLRKAFAVASGVTSAAAIWGGFVTLAVVGTATGPAGLLAAGVIGLLGGAVGEAAGKKVYKTFKP